MTTNSDSFNDTFQGLDKDQIGALFGFGVHVFNKGGFVSQCDRAGLIKFIKHVYSKYGCWLSGVAAMSDLYPDRLWSDVKDNLEMVDNFSSIN